jgi:hypothetical protein
LKLRQLAPAIVLVQTAVVPRSEIFQIDLRAGLDAIVFRIFHFPILSRELLYKAVGSNQQT